MKLFKKLKDGGKDSSAWAYFVIEWKPLFSIALLRFDGESRDAYHTHAFNAVSWLIAGELDEQHRNGRQNTFKPSLKPIWTPRQTFHKVSSKTPTSWALTFRGPWSKSWKEYRPAEQREVGLTHGRKEFNI